MPSSFGDCLSVSLNEVIILDSLLSLGLTDIWCLFIQSCVELVIKGIANMMHSRVYVTQDLLCNSIRFTGQLMNMLSMSAPTASERARAKVFCIFNLLLFESTLNYVQLFTA